MLNKTPKQQGFSLLEIAIALILITLLMQTGLSALNQARQINSYQATAQQLQDIKQALLSFVQINSYLPCPDTDNDGIENRKVDGSCQANRGALPYLALNGIGKQDEFGNPFLYAINLDANDNAKIRNPFFSASLFANFGNFTGDVYQCIDNCPSQCPDTKNIHRLLSHCNSHCALGCETVQLTRSTPPYFHQATAPLGAIGSLFGGLRVCKAEAATCESSTSETATFGNVLPLVVVSYGKNGAATWQNCNSAGINEQENCDNDAYFRQQPLSEEFDDQLIWLTMHEIKALMRGQLNWHPLN